MREKEKEKKEKPSHTLISTIFIGLNFYFHTEEQKPIPYFTINFTLLLFEKGVKLLHTLVMNSLGLHPVPHEKGLLENNGIAFKDWYRLSRFDN